MKTLSTAESTDPDVNAEFTHSHCIQKPNLSGFKWGFFFNGKVVVVR